MTVTVRKYRLKDGQRQALYLDIYHRGVRRRESLNFYLTGKREADREPVKLAELIASKRRLNLAEDENAIKTPRRRGGDFIAYAGKIADAKRANDAGVWRRALAHFGAYAGPRVPFDRLTPSLLEGFKGYLLEKLKPGSAWTYWRKVVSGCRRAMKDGIISRHPAADISFPKPEAEREFLTPEELRRLAAPPASSQPGPGTPESHEQLDPRNWRVATSLYARYGDVQTPKAIQELAEKLKKYPARIQDEVHKRIPALTSGGGRRESEEPVC